MQQPLTLHNKVETLPSIEIASSTSFSYYGDLNQDHILNLVQKYVTEVIQVEQSDHPDQSARSNHSIVLDGCRQILQIAQDSPACWIVIRVFRPTTAFEIPRWHQDGRMFKNGDSYKLAVTLCGPPTRVLCNTPFVMETISHYNSQEEQNVTRLAKELSSSPLVDIEPGQIFAFTCGKFDAPVHSEPNINTNRIFVAVVPGSVEQLKQMAKDRGRDYISLI